MAGSMFCSSVYITDRFYRMFGSGKLRPVIYHEIYSLDRLVDGLEALAKRKSYGKVILHIKDELASAKL